MTRALALSVFALLLAGCSLSAGPVIVHSPSLGFRSPYLGATVRGDLDGERFIARAEGSILDSEKTQTGDGYGGTGEALAGAKFGRFSTLGGYRFNRYVTSAYSKNSAQWLAQGGYTFVSGGTVSATYSLESDGSGWDSYGLRVGVPLRRVLMISTWEHLRFEDQSGAPVQGDRISLAALWKFK